MCGTLALESAVFLHRALQGGRVATILVVEDDDNLRILLRMSLRMQGHDVAEAADGSQALDVASHIVPDLVIMDVYMPGMDGIEVTALLRARSGLEDVRVLLVSGGPESELRERGLAAGAVGFLPKPVDLDGFADAVASSLAET
jgi:CheY-like chemotaxis protein